MIKHKISLYTLKARLFFTRNPNKKKILIKRIKEVLIAIAISTPEGRRALAEAMVEPIRRALEYQALAGVKLLNKEG